MPAAGFWQPNAHTVRSKSFVGEEGGGANKWSSDVGERYTPFPSPLEKFSVTGCSQVKCSSTKLKNCEIYFLINLFPYLHYSLFLKIFSIFSETIVWSTFVWGPWSPLLPPWICQWMYPWVQTSETNPLTAGLQSHFSFRWSPHSPCLGGWSLF